MIYVLGFSSGSTYLGTLNLSGTTPSFSYQDTLPLMPDILQSGGIFSNNGLKFYLASWGGSDTNYPFYTNLTPSA